MPTFFNGLINRDNEQDGTGGALLRPFGLETVTLAGSTIAYIAAFGDDAITAFTVESDGSLTPLPGASVTDSLGVPLEDVVHVTAATVGGTTFLYAGLFSNEGLTSFRLDGNGTPIFIENIPDNATLEIDTINGTPAVATVGSTSFLIAAGIDDDGFSVFEINADGRLTNTDNVDNTDANSGELDGPGGVASAIVDGNTFVFVTADVDDAINAYRLDANGTVTLTDTVSDTDDLNLRLNGAFGVDTATVDGTTYVFVAGRNDDGISVFSVDGQGQLTNVFNLADNGDLGINGAFGLRAFTLAGETFLSVSGFAEDSLSVFHVAANGALQEVDTVFDNAELELDGSVYSEFTMVDGTPLLVATGFSDDGVSSFEPGGDDDLLEGSGTRDTLLGLGGEDTVIGRGGDDRLLGGLDNDSIEGGNGNDTIDGQKGRDTLGGGNDSDLIRGGGGNDEMDGDRGNDRMFGATGNDTMDGGDGGDRMNGGANKDVMAGGRGNDTMDGGGARDRMEGEGGRDMIKGGLGNDLIDGGRQNDTIEGGEGRDRITTGSGRDIVVFNEGDGRDVITDQSNRDRLDLTDFDFDNFGEVLAITSQRGSNLVINFGGGDRITMRDFDLSDFSAGDVII